MGSTPDRGHLARTTLAVGVVGLLVAALALIVTWLQPSATKYQDRAQSCSSSLHTLSGSAVNLESIPGRLTSSPDQSAQLAKEYNQFVLDGDAVGSNCPIGEKAEYIDVVDYQWYRGNVQIAKDCTIRVLSRSATQCGPGVLHNAVGTTLVCAGFMSSKADTVAKWSTFTQWKNVYSRWRNNSDPAPSVQVINPGESRDYCGIENLDDPWQQLSRPRF